MRIAVSGTHFSGKSTLIKALLKQLPGYVSVEEPYYLLEEEGYECPHPPSVEDFEEQMKRSVLAIKESKKNTIFDRCPLDCLAYAMTIAEISPLEDEVDIEIWTEMMQEAIALLDLIVYVPIEKRVLVPEDQDFELRDGMDATLQELILEDSLEILDGIEIIEVTGSLENRAKIVLSHLKG